MGSALIFFGLLAVISGASSLLDNESRLFAPKGAITVEVVESPEDRTKGLSGRQNLADNRGMLFVFEESSQEHCIWMKDMQFSIDIVWLNEKKEVVYLRDNVSPETYPEAFCPDSPAKYVLELPAGKAEKLEIVRNATLRF